MDRFESLRRVGLAAGGLTVALMTLPAWARDDGLPQRNLLVEWRINGQGQTQASNQGVRTGQVIIDSRGGVVGRTSVGMETVQTESQADTVQQLQVLNGGRAKLFVGRSQPYTIWQWAWTATPSGSSGGDGTLGVIGPQSGANGQPNAGQPGNPPGNQAGYQPLSQVNPAALPQTVWIDLGDGMYVRPRWAGGQAPVIVELEAQARQPAQAGGVYTGQIDPDGQTRHMEVASTLSVPLGQWAVVARSGSRVQRQQSGTLSTRDVDDSQSQQLEIRVTAP